MQQLIFQRRVVLTALLVVFLNGCAANTAPPPGVKNPAAGMEQQQPGFDAARTSDAARPNAAASKGAPGIVVHIDPTTGEFLPEPAAAGVTPPQRADAAKAPAPQFDVVPSPMPGGGYMIDLKNHFRTPLVATMDADGKVTIRHEPMSPTGAENK